MIQSNSEHRSFVRDMMKIVQATSPQQAHDHAGVPREQAHRRAPRHQGTTYRSAFSSNLKKKNCRFPFQIHVYRPTPFSVSFIFWCVAAAVLAGGRLAQPPGTPGGKTYQGAAIGRPADEPVSIATA